MEHFTSPALRHLITRVAIIIRLDAAVVLRVAVGEVGAATNAGGLVVCTNVPAHIVPLIIETLHVVVTDDLTLGVGCVGWTVLGTLAITRL